MKGKNKLYILFLVALAGACLLFYSRGRSQKDLQQNGVLVQAKIIKVLSPYKGGTNFSFLCEFTYKKKVIRASSPSNVSGDAYSYLGKVFTALYAEKSGTLQLLLDEDDYIEFNREFPGGDKIR